MLLLCTQQCTAWPVPLTLWPVEMLHTLMEVLQSASNRNIEILHARLVHINGKT